MDFIVPIVVVLIFGYVILKMNNKHNDVERAVKNKIKEVKNASKER